MDASFASRAKLQTRFRLTETGYQVMRGNVGFVELNGIDLWVGGVHLSADNNLSGWDEKNEVLSAG